MVKIIFELKNLTNNDTRKVVARNINEACEKLNWQRANIILVSRKVMPDDWEE